MENKIKFKFDIVEQPGPYEVELNTDDLYEFKWVDRVLPFEPYVKEVHNRKATVILPESIILEFYKSFDKLSMVKDYVPENLYSLTYQTPYGLFFILNADHLSKMLKTLNL